MARPGFRPTTTLDVKDFEPRQADPVNSRLSPEKTVICSGFAAPAMPRHSNASSASSSTGLVKSKATLAVDGLLGARERERTPFTPVRQSRKRAESVSPAMLAGHHQPEPEEEQRPPPAQRTAHSSMLSSGFETRPVSMLLSPSSGLPVPPPGRTFRPSTGSSPRSTLDEPQFFAPQPSPLAREVSAFPAPAPPPFSPPRHATPRLTSTQPRPSSPTSAMLSSPLAASPSTPKIRARVTPMASPRRKQLLPGAPNPDHLPSRPSSPTKGLSSPGGPTMKQRLRAVASVPALRSKALASSSAEGWITGGRSSTANAPGLGISLAPHAWNSEPVPAAQSNVLVCVRVRPANHATSRSLAVNDGEVDGSDAWLVDERAAGLVEASAMHASVLGGPAPEEWRFDAVRCGSENSSVYDVAARDLVLSCMHGYDTSIFAYGQTASGKTFTLTGSPSNPGVIPLAVRDVFAFIRSNPSRDFLLRASYLELYNETLRDLLSPSSSDDDDPSAQQLRVRQDPSTGNFFAAGAREEVVSCEAHVEALLRRGETKRRVAGTEWNARSSRSHTVFAIVVESREAGSAGEGAVRLSRLSLIDLAGSERAAGQQERRAEGAFINKSLLTLEKVIAALADSATSPNPPQHIPYRDSKLTQLLQPSLSGSARVAVICTVNPSNWAVDESRSTLRFARRCKKVRVRAEVNEVVSEKALITRYRMQIAELQAQLATATSQPPAPASPSTATTPRQASPGDDEALDLKAREKRRRERERAERATRELKDRLEKLQGIVLNASNVDQGRKRRVTVAGGEEVGDREGPRPVSPVKGMRGGSDPEDEEDDDDTGKITAVAAPVSREVQLEQEASSLRRQVAVLQDELAARPSLPSNATADEVDVRVAELEREVMELKVVVTNADVEAVEERCRSEFEREKREVREELKRRKEFEDELRRELEEARNRCKKLELYIIDELSHTASSLARPRRSSLSSTIGLNNTLSLSTSSNAAVLGETAGGARTADSDEFGVRRTRPEEALGDLMSEGMGMECVRASFAGLDVDVGEEMEGMRSQWRRRGAR